MSHEIAFLISQIIGLGIFLGITALINMKWPNSVDPYFFAFGYTLTGMIQYWFKFLR